jgi:hypothetical protein
MTIMMVLIHGSKQRKSPSPSQRLCMPLNEENDIEGQPREILCQINPWPKLSLDQNI